MSEQQKRPELDRHPERGAVLVIVAVVLPVIFIMAAVVIDLGYLFKVRTQLQGTADAAALAAAAQLPDTSRVGTEARNYAELNYPGHGTIVDPNTDVEIGIWNSHAFTPLSGTSAVGQPNAVRVTARRSEANGNQVPLFLGGFVGRRFSNVSASAVAAFASGIGSCVISLAPSGRGLHLHADAVVNTPHCTYQVNSTGVTCPVVEVGSKATLISAGVNIGPASGCVAVGSPVTLDPDFTRQAPPVDDPLLSIPVPPNADSWTCQDNDGKFPYTTTLSPGVYCKGIEVQKNAKITFNPGVYVIRGPFSTNDGTELIGNGVTFFTTCTTYPCGQAMCGAGNKAESFQISSGTKVTLSAPTSGTYSGMLFFQDRTMKVDQNMWIEPTGGGRMDGILYFRCADVTLQKTLDSSWNVSMVAWRVTLKGTTNFSMPPSSMSSGTASPQALRLVQ